MVGIENYIRIIKSLLNDLANNPPSNANIDMETIFDDQQLRYQLLAIGWQGKRRIHSSVIHIDIINNKLWLQHNSTDIDIPTILLENGVAQDHIVLGFQPEHIRKHSNYAIS